MKYIDGKVIWKLLGVDAYNPRYRDWVRRMPTKAGLIPGLDYQKYMEDGKVTMLVKWGAANKIIRVEPRVPYFWKVVVTAMVGIILSGHNSEAVAAQALRDLDWNVANLQEIVMEGF